MGHASEQAEPGRSIVIPAYNEERNIDRLLDELCAHFGPDTEIIVVDDGSSDSTADMAAAHQGVRLVRHKVNRGYGASLKTGMLESRADVVCFVDGDGQHSPADVEKVLEAMDDADMVIGSRGSDGFSSPVRGPGKRLLHWLCNFLVDSRIPDLNSGLRAVRRELILRYLHLLPDGFSASTNSTMIFLLKRYLVRFVPITVRPRQGKSHVSVLRDGFNTLLLILRVATLYNPLRFFIPLSLFWFVAGILYTVWIFTYGPGLGMSVGAFLMMFLSVMSFVFGLLADQIATIRTERHEDAEAIHKLRIKH